MTARRVRRIEAANVKERSSCTRKMSSRAAWLVLLFVFSAGAQDQPVVRGVLVRRDPGVKTGELTLRDAHNTVLRYRFDPHTYVERDNRSIDTSDLRPGDPVEVVSEAVPGATVRAARSIHVLSPAIPGRHPAAAPAPDPPKSDLSFSGLILRVTTSRLVLHQHDGGDQEILLGPDTRFLENGDIVAPDRLRPNMRVSVRAGLNVSGKVEANQVVWGSMLAPK